MTNELVEFYNLHLKAGRPGKTSVYDISQPLQKSIKEKAEASKKEELIFPDDNERNRILNFFKKYAVLLMEWKLELPEHTKEEVFADIRKDNPQIVGDVSAEDFWKFVGSHMQQRTNEKLLSKMLKLYEAEKGVSWFESPVDFPDFADEYKFVKALVDGYLQKEIPVEALAWLDMRRKQHTLTTMIETQEGQQYSLNYLKNFDKLHAVDLKTQKLVFINEKAFRYTFGIPLGSLWFHIHWQLTMMLQGRLQIQRCEAGKTPKMPACQNIFVPQRKGAKYCSDSCRMRIYQSKRRAELKGQDEELLAQARASLREYRESL